MTCKTPHEDQNSEIIFKTNEKDWCMRLTKKGIFFNRDKYPDSTTDDFAISVIKILEKEFSVKFERNSPPYQR